MYAPFYSNHATVAGEVASQAEDRKCVKHAGLPVTHSFTAVAVETSGVSGPKTWKFLKELGRRVRRETGEEKASSFLYQKISVAVQCRNLFYYYFILISFCNL